MFILNKDNQSRIKQYLGYLGKDLSKGRFFVSPLFLKKNGIGFYKEELMHHEGDFIFAKDVYLLIKKQSGDYFHDDHKVLYYFPKGTLFQQDDVEVFRDQQKFTRHILKESALSNFVFMEYAELYTIVTAVNELAIEKLAQHRETFQFRKELEGINYKETGAKLSDLRTIMKKPSGEELEELIEEAKAGYTDQEKKIITQIYLNLLPAFRDYELAMQESLKAFKTLKHTLHL